MSKPKISTFRAVRHGLALRCPQCGKGKLFRSYLKPVECCAVCGEALGSIRADDGPAWLTVLVIGHIVVGAALYVEQNMPIPVWASMALFAGLTLAMTLMVLPLAKGIFIGAIWAMKPPGSGVD